MVIILFAVSHKSLNNAQVRQLSLLYIQQTVRSSRTPRAGLRPHVECAVGINVMRGDGKKVYILQNRLIFEMDRAAGPARLRGYLYSLLDGRK